MKPAKLLRILNRLATKRGWVIAVEKGSGAHMKVTLNGARTVIAMHGKDLKTGTYLAILKQLRLTEADLEE